MILRSGAERWHSKDGGRGRGWTSFISTSEEAEMEEGRERLYIIAGLLSTLPMGRAG